MKAAVVGASGFLGGELVRLLAAHPFFELAMVCSGSTAGRLLSEVRPGLPPMTLQEARPEAIAAQAQVAFLALPHGESASLAAALVRLGVVVIDLGSDFRLAKPGESERWYGRPGPDPELLLEAVYCLPEIFGPPGPARLIACPGCFATALSLVTVGLGKALPAGSRLDVFGVTGSSGSGIAPSAGVHHSLRPTNFKAYKALRHQHMGELNQTLTRKGLEMEVRFAPHSLPAVRGIHLTAIVDISAESALAALRSAYEGRQTVDIREGVVEMGAAIGSIRAHIGVEQGEGGAVVTCAIDNLLKGGSGQAIQIANLRFGRPEAEGLPLWGVWP